MQKLASAHKLAHAIYKLGKFATTFYAINASLGIVLFNMVSARDRCALFVIKGTI